MRQAVIESGRAKFAFEAVISVKENGKISEKTKKEFKSYCRKFPSLVLTNGLAASIAFAKEKGKAYDYIYDTIANWLKKNKSKTELLEYVCSLNSDEYQVVTKEVLALFEWLRRFASGLIEGEAVE